MARWVRCESPLQEENKTKKHSVEYHSSYQRCQRLMVLYGWVKLGRPCITTRFLLETRVCSEASIHPPGFCKTRCQYVACALSLPLFFHVQLVRKLGIRVDPE